MKDGVLITAGNKRIGRAIALTLYNSGYHIFLHHHDSEQEALETSKEVNGNIFKCDLGDYDDVERMLSDILKYDIPLKHVVNNASLFSDDDVHSFNEETFADHMNINLRGPMQLARGLYALLERDHQGSVVNILDSKVFALNADFHSYTISKFGLYGATEMMAQGLSPKVRVNGVAPGLTLISETQSDTNFEFASHLNFVGAPINVEDVARSVLHLIEAKSINGAVLPVDGGQKMMNFTKDVVNVAEGILKK